MMIVLVNKNKEVVNFKTGEVFRVLDKTIDVSKENLFEEYIYYNKLVEAINTEKEVFMKNIDTSMEIDYDKYDVYIFTPSKNYYITNIIKAIQSEEVVGFKVLTKDMCAAHGNQMKYELGKLYEEDVIPTLCKCGFHFSNTFIGASKQYMIERDIRMFRVKVPKGSLLTASFSYSDNNIVLASNKIVLEEEINAEDYLKNKDILKEYDKFMFGTCIINNFELSPKFYEFLLTTDLSNITTKDIYLTKFNRIRPTDEWSSEWEELIDKIIEKFDKDGDANLSNEFIYLYSDIDKKIRLIQERNIYDLSLYTTDVITKLGIQYFLDNADKFNLKSISIYRRNKLHSIYKLIDSPDIIFQNIDNILIKRFLRNGISIELFTNLIKNHFDWVASHLNDLNVLKFCDADDVTYKEFLLKLNTPQLHFNKLTITGVNDMELFVELIKKSEIKFKDYKQIKFRTMEQVEFVIKKCRNRYDMILDILYSNKDSFGKTSIFGIIIFNQDVAKFEYLIKKYSKLNKRQNKKKYFNFRRIAGHIPEDFDDDFGNGSLPNPGPIIKTPIMMNSQERHPVDNIGYFVRRRF